MKTGEPIPRTGLYRSDCSCGTQVLSKFGEIAPPCWNCRAHVSWTFLRASMSPPTPVVPAPTFPAAVPPPSAPSKAAPPKTVSARTSPPRDDRARAAPAASAAAAAPRAPRGLLVASDPGVVERAMARLAPRDGAVVDLVQVPSLVAALRTLHERAYAVVVLDLVLPDSRGPGAVHRVRETAPSVPVVVVTDRERDPASGLPRDEMVRRVIPRSRLDGPDLRDAVCAALGVPVPVPGKAPAAATTPPREGRSRVA